MIVGAELIFGQEEQLAECGLIIWRNSDSASNTPVIAEFSFRYKNEDGEFSGDVASSHPEDCK